MGSPLICLCKDRERERGPLSGDGHLLQATQKTVQHKHGSRVRHFPLHCIVTVLLPYCPLPYCPITALYYHYISLYIVHCTFWKQMAARSGEKNHAVVWRPLSAGAYCLRGPLSAPGRGNSGARPAVFFLIPPCYIIQLHRVCFYLHTAMTSCLLLESTLPPIRNSRFPILDSRLSPKIGRTLSIPTWRAVKVRYRQ